ncbi:mechanosensitive ion channel family protein [Longimicrobium sp.]|uniref:mechanosensitive ion channel family protein n=1 Tax=Longimicrobium sp. TaxID=2029185 RepID=UPI002BAD5B32|nr:mechanosensitive ion channel domain-containing protein [Longimicrobium sp.]HSU12605.1 mechanosensitive ion channel domain-containing protein [Longimicrobium sp.]
MLQKADSILAKVRAVTSREPTTLRDLLHPDILLSSALRVAGAVLVAFVLWWTLRIVLRRIERKLGKPQPGALTVSEQRTRTLVSLLRSVGRVIIFVIFLFMLLSAIGLDLGPLLAGAGVVGLAVSFGAQSLVKDVISGLFILIENQFGVGDVVRIEGVSGAVERMTLRVVVLRDVHGVVHIVPNGEIKKVSNLTRTWSRVVLDVGVAYKEDVDRVIAVMRDVGRELWDDPEWRPLLVDAVEVPGIESFGESSVTIRLMAKTLPLKQWDVARELRRRLKRRFDREEIEIPFPHQKLVWDGGGPPPQTARIDVGGAGDDEAGDVDAAEAAAAAAQAHDSAVEDDEA